MVKRLGLPLVLGVMLILAAGPLWGKTGGGEVPPDKEGASAAVAITATVATVTGIAISPLLGTAGYGVYLNVRADTPEKKAALPWFAKWTFILPALLVVGACAAKDAFGATIPPPLKKPFDVAETLENKLSGLVAAGAVVPFTMSALSKWVVGGGGSGVSGAGLGGGLSEAGLATVQVGAVDWSWLLSLMTVPLGVAVFVFVWMASHAINALILLSPWGAIDAVLKGARTGLLGLVVLMAAINPWLSALLSLVLVVTAYWVAGWSFRLTVFGAVFSWEFLVGKNKRFEPSETGGNGMFSGAGLTKAGVPMRTWGRLEAEMATGGQVFTYRPWLVMTEKRVEVSLVEGHVGKGLFFSTLREGDRTAFILPPRYRGHEDKLVTLYGLRGIEDAGMRRAWGAMRELFGGGASRTQLV